jgi:uncharacterized membrane protein
VTVVIERLRARAPASAQAAQDQVVVAGGQIAAGVGNMLFSLVMARLLTPGAFAQLATFLALYLVFSMPGVAISAAAALAPAGASRAWPILWRGGVLVGLIVAAASPWVGPALRLPVAMVVVLGLSGPAVGTLALGRGRLYGWNRRAALVASFLVEPAVRLALGVVLTLAIGAVGGAVAVIVGGYAALEIARRRVLPGDPASVRRHRGGEPSPHLTSAADPPSPALRAAKWTAVAFLALVVVQNQDLLIANRILTPGQAGQFAVLSTIGGLAAFATMTIPLVLLPRSRNGAGGLLPALLLTTVIGSAAVALVAVMPSEIIGTLFGSRYDAAGAALVPYMAAMALLGIARVLVAHRCAVGAERSSAALIAGAIATQAVLILSFGHDTRTVAYSTVVAVTGLTVGLGTAEGLRVLAFREQLAGLWAALRRPPAIAVEAAVAIGVVERFIIPRGLWLDEATSVFDARRSFGGMLGSLRAGDVHPPLYFSILWAVVHRFGSGPLAVRLPSIVAGTLVVPMLYLLGREAYDRRTGVIAALAGAVAPIMVWYSQEARMYALLMLFGVIAMWAQVRIFRGARAWVWCVYAVSSVALVWTQYFGAFQLVVQQLAFVAMIVSRHRRGQRTRDLTIGWVTSAAFIALCLAPLLPFAYQQFVVNQSSGKGFGGPQNVGTALRGGHLDIYAVLANLIWAVWGYQPNPVMTLLGALWPVGMLFALVLLGRRHQSVTTLLVLCVVGPGLALLGLGLLKRNLFDIRYLSTVVPILFVLIARLLTAVPRRTLTVVACAAVLLATLVTGLVDQQYNGANPRDYDFSGAVTLIEAHARPGSVVYYEPSDLRQVIQYYGPHMVLKPLTSRPGAEVPGRPSFILASHSLMNGASDISTLNGVLQNLRLHHRLLQHRNLSNVETWEFR